MPTAIRSFLSFFLNLLHWLAFCVIPLIFIALLSTCLMAAFGFWPWIDLDIGLGGEPIENAGMFAQIGLTTLALTLIFFLPSSQRTMALENAHRSFSLGVHDVARAYHHAHAADRSGVFQQSSEFETVRERLAYLRDHPELEKLEPEILELASKMSYISRNLAETYSDDQVDRAWDFLRQRQQEVDRFNIRFEEARTIHLELKHWLTQVELEESVAAAQLERLRDELLEILPEMGIETIQPKRKVIELPRAAE